MFLLGILSWIVIGVVIGFAVSKLLNLRGDDPRLGLAASAVGALLFAGAYVFFSGSTVDILSPWQIGFAVIGAGVALAAWHGIRSRFISHAPVSRRRSY